jgi:hypothetical protein
MINGIFLGAALLMLSMNRVFGAQPIVRDAGVEALNDPRQPSIMEKEDEEEPGRSDGIEASDPVLANVETPESNENGGKK